MKNAPSLEEERRALLEQIHASRDAYRRMLTEQDMQEAAAENRLHALNGTGDFPRSSTIRWIIQHPYLTVAAVAGAAVAAPKLARSVARWRSGMSGYQSPAYAARHNATQPVVRTAMPEHLMADQKATAPKRLAVLGRSAITSLVAMASMALRDPAKMRMATRLFSLAAGFVSARRARRLQ